MGDVQKRLKEWIVKPRHLLRNAACCLVICASGFAQEGQVTVLTVRTSNIVQYHYDLADPLKIASQGAVTSRGPVANFYTLIDISDVTEVNGTPVKGMVVLNGIGLNSSPVPQTGQAIADIGRVAGYSFNLDLSQTDGTPIGTIIGFGLGGGPASPGIPGGAGSLAITGGTGAFLGARGQFAFIGPQGSRRASMAEDPANRRINGGGNPGGWYIELIPMVRPQLTTIFHGADFSLVTPERPARAGELLVAIATGLGPVRGQTPLGGTFPEAPLAEINSPVSVFVNGSAAEVLNKVGWPGTTDLPS
jgi:hypothetical protein